MQCHQCDVVLPTDARFCLACGARVETAPDPTADPLREALDKAIGFQYRIERLLGRGGMGAVYLAHELALDRDVAIKVLPPDQAGAPMLRERFRREARTAARLRHPNIVPLHTFGEVAGLIYFVMGYVAGESLASRLKRQGRLDPEETRTLVAEICGGLDYAHRHGVVHRDIKPDNILIDDESGAPLLMDFGIAKAPTLVESHLTPTGQLIGTPHYMSPEQALGSPDVGARSDLYSLGVVAYEMLSGRRPFDAENPIDALTQRLTQTPRPLRSVAPDVPDDLMLAINRCLLKDPEHRWADAGALRATLMPSDDDDEPEDSFRGRALRIGVSAASVMLLALGHLTIFARLDPASEVIKEARLPFTVIAAAFSLMAAVAAISLRWHGLDSKAIVRRALLQPRWWRFWYPKAWRRRGDVWDRLPWRLRRLRVAWAVGFLLIVCVLTPVALGLRLSHRWPAAALLLQLATFALLGMLFVERHRSAKYIAATLGTSALEASKILSMPTWRVSAWRRTPSATLLLGQPIPSHRDLASLRPVMALPDRTEDDDTTRA
jgi:hypothetical protein